MLARLSPGGVTKICILYDEQSDLFWLTANHPIDHLPDLGALRKRGFVGVPANERRIPNLYYRLDCFNWFQAGTVAMSRSQLESFSYPSMLIVADVFHVGKHERKWTSGEDLCSLLFFHLGELIRGSRI